MSNNTALTADIVRETFLSNAEWLRRIAIILWDHPTYGRPRETKGQDIFTKEDTRILFSVDGIVVEGDERNDSCHCHPEYVRDCVDITWEHAAEYATNPLDFENRQREIFIARLTREEEDRRERAIRAEQLAEEERQKKRERDLELLAQLKAQYEPK